MENRLAAQNSVTPQLHLSAPALHVRTKAPVGPGSQRSGPGSPRRRPATGHRAYFKFRSYAQVRGQDSPGGHCAPLALGSLRLRSRACVDKTSSKRKQAGSAQRRLRPLLGPRAVVTVPIYRGPCVGCSTPSLL